MPTTDPLLQGNVTPSTTSPSTSTDFSSVSEFSSEGRSSTTVRHRAPGQGQHPAQAARQAEDADHHAQAWPDRRHRALGLAHAVMQGTPTSQRLGDPDEHPRRRVLATTSPTPWSPRSAFRGRRRPAASRSKGRRSPANPAARSRDDHSRAAEAGRSRSSAGARRGRRPAHRVRVRPPPRLRRRDRRRSTARASCASRRPATRSPRSATRGSARTRRTSRCSCSSRVITKLGALRQVHTGVIEGLFASDLAFLQDLYRRINQRATPRRP